MMSSAVSWSARPSSMLPPIATSTASKRSSEAVAPTVAGDPVAELVAALDGLWRGQRTEEGEESERRGGAHGVVLVACTLGMEERALVVGRRVRIAIHGDVAHEPQPGREPFVVVEHARARRSTA